jgi:hypothetical protein
MDIIKLKDFDLKTVFHTFLLLILAVSGSWIGETFPCQLQAFLANNMLAKQFIILFIIYFGIGFSSSSELSPIKKIQKSFILWLAYLIFTKMDLRFSLLVIAIFVISNIVIDYINYYKEISKNNNNNNNNKKILLLNKIKNYLLIIIIAFMIIGFSIYFMKQYKDHSKNFNMYKFIFGIAKCGGK